MRMKICTKLLSGIVICFLSYALAQADSNQFLKIGMNKVDLGWIEQQRAEKVLADMRAVGIKALRVTLTPPFSKAVDSIALANRFGIGVLLNVNLNFPPFNLPEVTEQRFGSSGVWPLSHLDPEHAMRALIPLLDRIASERISLTGIEVGNEINWAGFNADLTAGIKDRKQDIGTLSSIQKPDDFRKGIRNYAGFVELISAYLRNDTRGLKDVTIYAGGIASVSEKQQVDLNAEFVDESTILAMMKDFGVDHFVDGYSVHAYLSRNSNADVNGERIAHLAHFCNNLGSGKRCAITELGIASPSDRCGRNDPTGAATLSEGLRKLSFAVDFSTAIYYFDWDSETEPFSIWRCNGLTDVGHALFPRTSVTSEGSHGTKQDGSGTPTFQKR